MPYLPSTRPGSGPSHQQTGGAPRRPVKPRGLSFNPQHRPPSVPRPAPPKPLSEAVWALSGGGRPARARPLSEGAWALSGGGGHHHHHHGGGGRGGGWGWGGGPWYPAGLPTIVEDPCTTPWLYPPGTCAQILAAQRGFGDAGAYQEARNMKVSLERVEGVGGSCCEGCGPGAQCSGLGAVAGTGSKLATYAVLGGIALIAYRAFFK